MLIAALILSVLIAGATSTHDNLQSSYNREPIATGVPYNNNCIIDELGWFDNTAKTSKRLQEFYNKTGVQPFIYLRAYDPDLWSDADKEQYAQDWYEANIDNESTFLYMYFAEYDQDGEVGFMAYVNGKQVSSVMDAEAVNIFWDYLDNAWYKDSSTDDMFVSVFSSTANKIMTKSTTGADVMNSIVVVLGVLVLIVGVLKIMQTRRKHESERNAETERILKTDIRGGSGDSSAGGSSAGSGDDLLDKWT